MAAEAKSGAVLHQPFLVPVSVKGRRKLGLDKYLLHP
jgi:hypothetical protein